MSTYQSTTDRDYPLASNPEADHWLDEAIKSQPLYFAEPSDKDLDPDSPINLSRFGLHNANQVKAFLSTSAGETVKTEIKAHVALDEAIEEQQMFELREQENLTQRIKAHLLLWIIEKKGHAASHLRELIEEQNTKAINQSKPDAKQQTKAPNESLKATEMLRQTLNNYNTAIKECEEQHELVSAEESQLTEEFENLHKQKVILDNKHELFMNQMAAFHEQIESYEQLSDEDLNTQMSQIEAELHRQTEVILDTLDSGEPGSEEKARELLDQQVALNLDLAQLKDIRSKRDKQKTFYDADGVEVPSAKEAAFIIGNDKKVVNKDGQYYLVKKEDNINEMTKEQLAQASSDFQKAEHEISTVSKAVTKTLKMEKAFHNLDQRIDDVSAKTQEKRDEKMNLENKIVLLQSVKASFLQQNPGLEQEAAPKPTPTLSGKAQSVSMPTPAPQAVIKITHTLIPFLSLGRRSPNEISEEIDKSQNLNNKEKGQAKDYFSRLIKLLNLGKIPSIAPLPETTMQSLLQHMSRFGVVQSKPGVSTEKGPLDLQEDVKMSPPLDGPHAKVGPKPPAPKPVNNPEEPEMKPFNPSPFKTGY
ncbi:MAG: hypothetical protein P4L79_02945 [Legionella sp.]|uniref:hypothetical protein n=1 Tax=Legionella sp. TaxID=459 RepID=UPI00284B1443|nr:hypothetical protein [Legionella sp.]